VLLTTVDGTRHKYCGGVERAKERPQESTLVPGTAQLESWRNSVGDGEQFDDAAILNAI
jgi:hypothetical protein